MKPARRGEADAILRLPLFLAEGAPTDETPTSGQKHSDNRPRQSERPAQLLPAPHLPPAGFTSEMLCFQLMSPSYNLRTLRTPKHLSLESTRSFPAEPMLVSLSGPKLPGPGRELQNQVPLRLPYKGSSDRTDISHVGARMHVRQQLIPRYSLFPL